MFVLVMQYDLPQGIEEMCFPDAKEWSPHPQQRTSTYMVVLTDEEGYRTFCYCRRIQAEGDDVCMPLAMCILTRHSRARSLFSQVVLRQLHSSDILLTYITATPF